ncbi:hypothetical protein BC829DRAFT_396124 [Chytridium lagenaria]|nr:hypothetical protein BC829DRAFT_396124 [Chytridium lagenaria]
MELLKHLVRIYEDNYGLLLSLWTSVLVMLMHAAQLFSLSMGTMHEAGYGPVEGVDVQPLLGGRRRGKKTDRFKRSADTALRSLLLLLTISIFLSIPIRLFLHRPHRFWSSPARVTLPSTILAWILLAMSVLWAILDAVAPIVGGMGALVGSVMGLASFPLAIAIFIIGLRRWGELASRTC